MRDVAAFMGAAIGLSYLFLRLYAYFSAISLCREALRSGRGFEAKVRWWSLALTVSTGATPTETPVSSVASSSEDHRSRSVGVAGIPMSPSPMRLRPEEGQVPPRRSE